MRAAVAGSAALAIAAAAVLVVWRRGRRAQPKHADRGPRTLVCHHRYRDGTSAWSQCGYSKYAGGYVTTCRICGKRVPC